MKQNDSFLTFVALQAALRAGECLRRGFDTLYAVSPKSGRHNLVTEFDKKAENLIFETIKEYYPNHAFLAEESGASQENQSVPLWIIDPLDGTLNFSHHIPIFTVSIAVYFEKEIICGVIYQPMTHEIFVAEKGKGAFLNGKKLRVSQVNNFENAMTVTGFPYEVDESPEIVLKPFKKILTMGNPIRDLGSAALNLAYTAAGRFDLYWIGRLHPWDVAAGKLLIEEAGGRLTHYNGTAYELFSHGNLAASNGILHEEFIRNLT